MGAARFTLITPQCVRIEFRADASRGFVDAPTLFAAARPSCPAAAAPLVVNDEPGEPPAVVSSESFELVFIPGGEGLTGRSLQVRVRGPEGLPAQAVWTPDSRQIRNLGGTLGTLDGLRGPPRRAPEGLLSRDGWYLIDDSRGHLLVDGWVRPRDAQPGDIDWYLFAYGRDYRAALRALAAVSGPVPVPRRYLLGSWYSRYWPHTSREYRAIVAEYAEHGFPLDVVVLDMDWHREGWTGWSWNRDLLPDAEDLLRWFHDRGLAVTLNLHPADGVGPHEDRYGPFMRALGMDPASRFVPAFDAGDRQYMTALFEQVLAPLERDGVDFWWVDWQQEKFVRSIPGLTNLQWLNRLFFEHTRGSPVPRRRGVSFSRWAGDAAEHRWGDHRHPIHFSGDAHTGWAMLAYQVPFTSTAGNVGCFFWSHDIGGHFGPRIEEATARWVQFGALSAALRLHSARSGVLDRRPWTYAEPFRESMRRAFALRAELMPHLYSEVHAACEQTVPLLRPMYLDHPGEERAYTAPRQYLLGADLLAAPVTAPGRGPNCTAMQAAWFPPCPWGRGWRRWETGERHLPGDEAIVAASIHEIPLFVREGVPVVLQHPADRMTHAPGPHLRVRLWPCPVAGLEVFGRTLLVEDDGVSDDAEARASTPIVAKWSAADRRDGRSSDALRLSLTIGPSRGAFPAQPARRSWTIELAGVNEILGVTSAGERINARIDPDRLSGLAQVHLPERPVAAAVTVDIEFIPARSRESEFQFAARRFAEAFGASGVPEPDRPSAAKEWLLRSVVERLRARRATGSASDAGGDGADVLALGAGIGVTPCDGDHRLIDTFGWIDGGAAAVEIIDAVGTRAQTIGRSALSLEGAGRSRAATVPMPRQPLATPPAGLRSSRWIRVAFRLAGEPVEFAFEAETALRPIDAAAWRVLGPFPWDWTRPIGQQGFSPERPGGDRLREHVARGQTWHDTGAGSWVTWGGAAAGEQWPVDFRRALGRDSGLAYAATTIISSRRQRARLHIDSSDKVEVWVNGERVFSQDGFDTDAALTGGASAALMQGRNSLLVKCASGGGGWGFSLAVEADREVTAEAELDPSRGAPHPTFG